MSGLTAAAWGTAIAAVCLTLGLFVYRIRKGAQDGVRADAAEKGNEDARKAIEISEANRRRSDDELRRKL